MEKHNANVGPVPWPVLWLVIGFLLLIVSNGIHAIVPLAAWLAPVFLIRFLRTQPTARALPGVLDLLERLRGLEDTTLGLVTGNYAETGAIKLRAAGIEPAWFPVGAWGADGAHRRELPPVAMRRYLAHAGREIAPERVVVIGDTPADVDCARASGCVAVAVATGPSFSLEELRSHGPDLLLEDLSDVGRLLEWIDGRRGPA